MQSTPNIASILALCVSCIAFLRTPFEPYPVIQTVHEVVQSVAQATVTHREVCEQRVECVCKCASQEAKPNSFHLHAAFPGLCIILGAIIPTVLRKLWSSRNTTVKNSIEDRTVTPDRYAGKAGRGVFGSSGLSNF